MKRSEWYRYLLWVNMKGEPHYEYVNDFYSAIINDGEESAFCEFNILKVIPISECEYAKCDTCDELFPKQMLTTDSYVDGLNCEPCLNSMYESLGEDI